MTFANQNPMDMTVRQAYDIYRDKARRSRPLSPMTISDSEYTLNRYAAQLWDRSVASITPQECAQLFSELTKIGPVAANRTLCYLRTLINVARDYTVDVEGHSVLLDKRNPVTVMLKHTPLNPVAPRNGRIPIARVRAVWRALKELGQYAPKPGTRTAADVLRFQMLTGTRRAESQTLQYLHVDRERNVIRVPPAVTKNYRSLFLPMPLQLSELIEHRRVLYLAKHPAQEVPPEAFIFDSDASRAGHIMNAGQVLKAVAGPDIAQYDLRRTFWDVAAQCGIDPDLRRQLLNLSQGDYSLYYPLETLLAALTRIAQWLDEPDVTSWAHQGQHPLH